MFTITIEFPDGRTWVWTTSDEPTVEQVAEAIQSHLGQFDVVYP